LGGAAGVVAAVEGEVPDRGELALDPVQSRGVGGRVDHLDVVIGAPGPDLGLAVRSVVVADQVELPGQEAAAELFAEVEELRPAFAVTEPVEHLPGSEVERGEHVSHPAGAGVGGPQPGRAAAGEPAATRAGLQVQRPELIDTDHPSVGGRVAVEVEDAGLLGHEVRVFAGFPGLRRLPRRALLAQDLADGLGARPDPCVFGEVADQLGQAPGRERQPQCDGFAGGDAADLITGGRPELSWSAAAPFWGQRRETRRC
jgi:hypothetical protein